MVKATKNRGLFFSFTCLRFTASRRLISCLRFRRARFVHCSLQTPDQGHFLRIQATARTGPPERDATIKMRIVDGQVILAWPPLYHDYKIGLLRLKDDAIFTPGA